MNLRKWILALTFAVIMIPVYAATAEATETTTTAPAPAPTAAPASQPSLQLQTVQLPAANFPKTVSLGDVSWTLGNNQEDKNLQLAEYVTNNENVNDWNQLITIQKFKFLLPKEVTPAQFAESEMAQLKKQGYKPKFTLIESSPREAIMEFQIDTPKSDQQDELQRIMISPEGKLVIYHYVIRKPDMGQPERTKWVSVLKKMDL